jgi:hypothetical protein
MAVPDDRRGKAMRKLASALSPEDLAVIAQLLPQELLVAAISGLELSGPSQ